MVELTSDLGGGKTTFVRGLARGAGSRDHVASPTFTISRMYKTPLPERTRIHEQGMIDPSRPPRTITIHHFDFYRLHEPGIMAAELADTIHDPAAVIIVEWGDVVRDVLPNRRLRIQIEQTPTGTRRLTFRAPDSLKYLIEAVD